jgi:hypothetical protein
MQYKTIILERIRQDREFHEELKKSGTLAATLDRWSQELKTRHDAWKQKLSHSRPESDPSPIASEALELALMEMEKRFASEPRASAANPLSLDDAIAFIRRPTPTA